MIRIYSAKKRYSAKLHVMQKHEPSRDSNLIQSNCILPRNGNFRPRAPLGRVGMENTALRLANTISTSKSVLEALILILSLDEIVFRRSTWKKFVVIQCGSPKTEEFGLLYFCFEKEIFYKRTQRLGCVSPTGKLRTGSTNALEALMSLLKLYVSVPTNDGSFIK